MIWFAHDFTKSETPHDYEDCQAEIKNQMLLRAITLEKEAARLRALAGGIKGNTREDVTNAI
ncbi:MAG: hypothetical protein WC374_06605 [Phycisphaerae bacterium]|jgi:hypothetical protein